MIEQMDQQLSAWVRDVHKDIELSLDPPTAGRSGKGINLYLLDLVNSPPLRGPDPAPLQFTLRYLVSTWAETVEEAHRLLGDLVFATMRHPRFEVELDPAPPETWSAFGLPPQPSFMLRALLQWEQPMPDLSRVLQPLQVRDSLLTSLSGIVLGPEDVPIAGALVEAPRFGRRTRTANNGRFVLSGLPTAPPLQQLRLRAKEFVLDVPVESDRDDELLVIHFNPLQEE
jgi:hypothetical protein